MSEFLPIALLSQSCSLFLLVSVFIEPFSSKAFLTLVISALLIVLQYHGVVEPILILGTIYENTSIQRQKRCKKWIEIFHLSKSNRPHFTDQYVDCVRHVIVVVLLNFFPSFAPLYCLSVVSSVSSFADRSIDRSIRLALDLFLLLYFSVCSFTSHLGIIAYNLCLFRTQLQLCNFFSWFFALCHSANLQHV